MTTTPPWALKKIEEAQLLPSLEPKLDWDIKALTLTFRFKYAFLPKGIMARLTVCLHAYLEPGLAWQQGAVFQLGTARALVRERVTHSTGDRVLEILVRGDAAPSRQLLGLVRSEVRALMRSFPKVRMSEEVPLTQDLDIAVPYEFLRKLKRKGHPQFYWPSVEEALSVSNLLEGLDETKLIQVKAKNCWHHDTNQALPFSIKQFAVERFQCIKQAHITDIQLDTRWIFILGDNGSGKSSLLQALAIGMCGEKGAEHLLPTDHPCSIEVEYQTDGDEHINRFYWEKTHGNPVSQLGAFLGYGPSRLLIQSEYGMQEEREQIQIASLLHQKGQLRNIEGWLKGQRQEAWDGKDPLAAQRFDTVKERMIELMPNVTDIRFEGKTVAYQEQGQWVPAHHLSAGHKSILAMVGDIIIHLMEQQPQAVDPRELHGIVLIDELELHLHPKWQVSYPEILTQAFPKVQFIASTHSPIPLIGAPLEAVILKVERCEEEGTRVERLDLDITRLLPNTLLTSPLFDLETLFNKHQKDHGALHTERHFSQIKTKEERLASLRRLSEELVLPDFSDFDEGEASE